MGMGSHEFWVERVMCHFIPSIVNKVGSSLQDKLNEIAKRISVNGECISRISHITEKWNQLQWSDESLLTIDVVYPLDVLLKGLMGYDETVEEMSHDPEEKEQLASLETFLSNPSDSSMLFAKHFKSYIVFNAKKDKFETVFGLTNSFLFAAMEWDKRSGQRSDRARAIVAKVRNCFSMLNIDASDPKSADLDGFRGNFTPDFYPMRYAMKDPIYFQIPFVLSYLLNHVCSRYVQAGVGYVEFSVGINDLSSSNIYPFLDSKIAFSEGSGYADNCIDWNIRLSEKMIKYKFLIGVARTRTINYVGRIK